MIAGRSTEAAPITIAGVVLSHPAKQHDAVDRVAADRLLDVHRHQVAKQHRGRLDLRLAERHDGELERHPARLPHARA